jgi:hypothetical protein
VSRAAEGPRRKRGLALLAALAWTAASLVSPPAQAAPAVVDAPTLALAIAADPATVVSAEYVTAPPMPDPASSPVVLADEPFAGFPRAGSTFAALSNGKAAGFLAGTVTGGDVFNYDDGVVHGDWNFDSTVMRIDVDVPAAANCLDLDLLFATDEFPDFVHEGVLVEIDATTWTTTMTTLSAPGDVALSSNGLPLQSSSPELTDDPPAAIARDRATGLLTVAAPISPGPHSIFVSIFDHQDKTTNSDVLLDNLRFPTAPAGGCVQGLHPAVSNVAVPIVSGQPTLGGTLTASSGTWTPGGLALTYQWLRSGTPIAGATAKTYSPTAADVGHQLSVAVTASNGSSLAAVSGETAAVTQPSSITFLEELRSSQPTVRGKARVGRTLTARPGAWGPGDVTFAYQWFRGAKAIRGAHAATYRVTRRDRGKSLHVVVTGAQPGFVTVTRTSPSTKQVKGG